MTSKNRKIPIPEWRAVSSLWTRNRGFFGVFGAPGGIRTHGLPLRSGVVHLPFASPGVPRNADIARIFPVPNPVGYPCCTVLIRPFSGQKLAENQLELILRTGPYPSSSLEGKRYSWITRTISVCPSYFDCLLFIQHRIEANFSVIKGFRLTI